MRSFADAGALVALSGGVDSALLAAVCAQELGTRALAVTAASEAVPDEEVRAARDLAAAWGLVHETARTHELSDPRYVANPADRCAFCKTELMGVLAPIARQRGLGAVLLGVNADDLKDHRPGQQAARERGALFPLAETGFTKAEVRALAKAMDLAVWDKPAQPCLASRIPYGQDVTAEKLARVERAEALLRQEGFPECRVRHDGLRASLEVPVDRLPGLLERFGILETGLRTLGFQQVTVDPEGFRSGKLNDILSGAGSRP